MKRILYLFLLVLLSTAVSADFTVEVNPIVDVISIKETAIFEINVTNNALTDDFRFYYDGVEWDIRPLSFTLAGGESIIFEVKARPLYVFPGLQSIAIAIRANSAGLVKDSFTINVRSETKSTYLPSVRVEYDIPKEIYPTDDLEFDLTIINLNPLKLDQVFIDVDSDLFSGFKEISLDSTTALGEGRKTVSFKFSFDKFLQPQDTTITIRITADKRNAYVTQETLTILPIEKEYESIDNVTSSFLKTVTKIQIINDGNTEQTRQHRVEIALFSQFFTSSDPEASILKVDGKRYLVWDVAIPAGESATITLVKNYRPFFLVLVLLIIAAIGYFSLRSPLTIVKRAEVIEKTDGAISMLKVFIKIRNISAKKIDHLALYDTIPSLVNYVDQQQLGTMSPSKVGKNRSGSTVLKFEIDSIDPFEERIISYKVKTQLRILGGINLPSMSARFRNQFGRQRIVRSNVLKLTIRK